MNAGLFHGMPDIKIDISISDNPNKENYFKNFCGACSFFQTLDCPFMSFVKSSTKYKDIGCKSFWD